MTPRSKMSKYRLGGFPILCQTVRQLQTACDEKPEALLAPTTTRLSTMRCLHLSFALSSAMKHLMLVLTILEMVSPVWAFGGEPLKQSFRESFQCKEVVPNGKEPQVLPASISREAIIQKLHPAPLLESDDEFERVCGVLARKLPFQRGNTAVFLVYQSHTKNRSGGYDSGDPLVQIGVFAQGEKPDWVAVTSSPIPLKDAVSVALDFAPYRMTPELTAFGLRWDRNFMVAGGGGTNQYLELFVVKGGEVTPVLSTLMRSSSVTAGEWHKDKTREHLVHGSQTGATISVLKTLSHGHFDLLKKQGGRQAVLKWDGNRYALTGKDPVQNVNDDD